MAATKEEIESLRQKASSALKRGRDATAAALATVEASTRTVVQSGTVGGTAFGWGLVSGRYGGTEILGLPGDLVSAVGFHAVAMFTAEDVSEHLHNVGDGSLAAYGHTMGLGIGARWKREAEQLAVQQAKVIEAARVAAAAAQVAVPAAA